MLSKQMQDALEQQIRRRNQLCVPLPCNVHAQLLRGIAGLRRLAARAVAGGAGHAMKLAEIVHDRGGRVTLQAVDKPPADFTSPLEIFKQVLAHEQKATALINKLYEAALKENDYATQVEVQWFIREQIEEEKNASTILDQLRLAGDSGAPLMMIDRALAARAANRSSLPHRTRTIARVRTNSPALKRQKYVPDATGVPRASFPSHCTDASRFQPSAGQDRKFTAEPVVDGDGDVRPVGERGTSIDVAPLKGFG